MLPVAVDPMAAALSYVAVAVVLAGVSLAVPYALAAVLAPPSAFADGLGSVLRGEPSRPTRTRAALVGRLLLVLGEVLPHLRTATAVLDVRQVVVVVRSFHSYSVRE